MGVDGMEQQPGMSPNDSRIRLAVYDVQKQFRIYHIGVLVKGQEFHYGMRIGVFACAPMNERKTFNVRYVNRLVRWRIKRFIDKLNLTTRLTLEQIMQVKEELSKKYRKDNYHLLNNNCIDFAKEFVKRIAAPVQRSSLFFWPQEMRQPLIICPIRLIFHDKEKGSKKEISEDTMLLIKNERSPKSDGLIEKESLQPQQKQQRLYITTIKIMPWKEEHDLKQEFFRF
uniref:PPPDE domain-containing protein n=1 Tax=Meloidogyne javanica TaxID=6303 RepID=A0A915MIZ8_MELJA